jgi:hypothetical protein
MRRALSALFLCATACSTSTPLLTASEPPTPATPTAGLAYVRTASPAATCRVLPTPEPVEPTHAPVNGQPTLGVPTLPGVILVRIPQCRDIQAIVVKYGLFGPATRYLDVLESDDMIANGATRWFRIGVVPGTEAATVVRLSQHPEDIEYVQLIPEFVGGAAGG